MIRYILVNIFLASVVGLLSCQSKNEGHREISGNPISEDWYADPEAVIFNKMFWIFPTWSAKYEEQVFLDAFSSPDLVNWTRHKKIIDTSAVKWAHKAMWAPCVVEKNGSYFLFFSANDIQTAERKGDTVNLADDSEGGIGIGIASSPEGPYRDYLGKPLISQFYNKAQPIDQFVFKDKDGRYYIIYGGWGRCNIARLNDDFTALIPFENGDVVREITPEGYVEGPFMFIRKGKYYLMWSEGGWTNETYKVAYAIADSPFGPFIKAADILQSDSTVATGAGHHSVLNIPGTDDWYIVYHRRPIPNKDRDHRVICIDKMFFNEDDSIRDVKMTFNGVEARKMN